MDETYEFLRINTSTEGTLSKGKFSLLKDDKDAISTWLWHGETVILCDINLYDYMILHVDYIYIYIHITYTQHRERERQIVKSFPGIMAQHDP